MNVTKQAVQDVSCSAMSKRVGMEGVAGTAFNRGLSRLSSHHEQGIIR